MRGVLAGLAITMLVAVGGAVVAQEGPSRQAASARTIGELAWLAGDWVGTAGANTYEERWTPPAAGGMLAVSRTIRDNRMVEFEFLRIVEREGGLVYVAQPGGRPPTDFVLTSLAGRVAVFENRAHDFPKVIRYALGPNDILEATVSDGAQKSQSYTYRRR